MKKLSYLLSLCLLVSATLLMGCGDDDPDGPTLAEQQLAALAGTWVTSSTSDVKLGSNDAPGDWSSFSIGFTESGGVNAQNQPSEATVFSVSSFEVSGTETAQRFNITFNGSSAESALVEVTDTSLTLSFTLNSDDDVIGARTQSVTGDWTFNLTKQ